MTRKDGEMISQQLKDCRGRYSSEFVRVNYRSEDNESSKVVYRLNMQERTQPTQRCMEPDSWRQLPLLNRLSCEVAMEAS